MPLLASKGQPKEVSYKMEGILHDREHTACQDTGSRFKPCGCTRVPKKQVKGSAKMASTCFCARPSGP